MKNLIFSLAIVCMAAKSCHSGSPDITYEQKRDLVELVADQCEALCNYWVNAVNAAEDRIRYWRINGHGSADFSAVIQQLDYTEAMVYQASSQMNGGANDLNAANFEYQKWLDYPHTPQSVLTLAHYWLDLSLQHYIDARSILTSIPGDPLGWIQWIDSIATGQSGPPNPPPMQ